STVTIMQRSQGLLTASSTPPAFNVRPTQSSSAKGTGSCRAISRLGRNRSKATSRLRHFPSSRREASVTISTDSLGSARRRERASPAKPLFGHPFDAALKFVIAKAVNPTVGGRHFHGRIAVRRLLPPKPRPIPGHFGALGNREKVARPRFIQKSVAPVPVEPPFHHPGFLYALPLKRFNRVADDLLDFTDRFHRIVTTLNRGIRQ